MPDDADELDDSFDSKLKYAFLDLNYPKGTAYCSALLNTGDFLRKTLEVVHKASGDKSLLAGEIAELVESDEVDADELLVAFCRQPRQWLSLAKRISGPRKDVTRGTAKEFLLGEHRKGQWYGPWKDPDDNSKHWLLRTFRVKHLLSAEENQSPQFVPIQCHIIAEITGQYAALHWNGFSHNDNSTETVTRGHQFQYWKHIPRFLVSLCQQGASVPEWPNLNDLVLNKLLAKYDGKETHKWEHIRVRSMRAGVTLNARGSASKKRRSKHDVDIGGLKALSRALARSALEAAYEDVEGEIDVADRAVLRTLIKEWGTRSYEFSLDKQDATKLFRAHCYFGVADSSEDADDGGESESTGTESKESKRDPGPDSFPHLLCYKPYGGSREALNFLVRQLQWVP